MADTDSIGGDDSLMDPNDVILGAFQERIKQQMIKQLEDVVLQLKETTNDLKKKKQSREDVGVELYNMQQQLAKLQEGWEKKQEDASEVAKLRAEREAQRDALNQKLADEKRKTNELQAKYFKYKSDLDKLAETLLRVEQFNEQMRSEIQTEKTSAYKAEDQIKAVEKKKALQDKLVDTINEQIKFATEKLAAYESQLDAQRRETRVAKDTLAEALAEMDAIKFEKQQLLRQWKTSLIGMQRRDEALKATEEALEKQKEALLALDNEIQGYKQSIRKEQGSNEELTHQLAKTEGEVNWLEKQIDNLLEKKQKANDKFTMLKRSLDHTDSESKKIDQECLNIDNQITTLEKRTQNINREVRKLEDKVMDVLNSQTTLKKGSQSTLQQIEKMKKRIREKELNVTNMENELARIRLDTLQTESHNETLKGTLADLEKELASNDSLIERMQVDIRRRHDEIERKQKHLDKLNRQYDEFISQYGDGTEGEGVGPLEATINNLSKAITQKSNENDQLQREWIKAQTELVNLKNQSSNVQDSIRELQAQTTILQQKRLRLTNQTQTQKRDIVELNRDLDGMHLRQKKLNTLIATNDKKTDEAANGAYNYETDLIQMLKERKREAVKLEDQVLTIKTEKERLLEDILETERQVMYWEKKIQIAKETEMALDPNIGKEEIQRMKQEISIMEQRLANLKRDHKRKNDDLLKAVDQRDILRSKGQAAQANPKKGVTKAQLQRETSRLANELKKKKVEAQNADKQIKASVSKTEAISEEVGMKQQQNEEVRLTLSALQNDIHVATLTKNRNYEKMKRLQDSLKRLKEAERGQYRPSIKPEAFERERQRQETERGRFEDLLSDLQSEFPTLRPDLSTFTLS